MARDDDHGDVDYDDDDIGFRSSMDGRYVAIGLLLLVISSIVAGFVPNKAVRVVCAVIFFASFFLITKRKPAPVDQSPTKTS